MIMKLFITRLLPGLFTVAALNSALSPVENTTKMFAAAADALSGETEGMEIRPTYAPVPTEKTSQDSVRTGLGAKRRSLESFASELETGKKEDYGWKAGDRAAKPIQLKPQPKGKPKPQPAAPPGP